MRLLLVTNDFPPTPGGIQQYLGSIVDHLDEPVRVLAPAVPDAAPDPRVVRARRRYLWPTPATRRWIVGHVRDFRPDIVLYGAPYPLAQLGPAVRRATAVPYGVLTHGAEVTIPAALPFVRTAVFSALRRADLLLAVSEFTRRRVARITGRPVRRLGAGVDVRRFHPVARAASDTAEPLPFVVGCVSRFVPRKGHDRVLRAVAALRAEGRDVVALLVGTGRLEARLRRLAERLGVPTTFAVGVPWDELPERYREMDVFAMPARSRWLGLEVEGLGIVYLEAAATGLPVLAGDSGGAPETVIPGATGFVAVEVDELTEGLRLLLDDPTLRAEMGEAGRRRIEAAFTWEVVVDRLRDFVEETVAVRR